MKKITAPVESTYASAKSVLSEAQTKIYGDSEVDPSSSQMGSLIEYHINLLKLFRALFTRQIEKDKQIPAATQVLQRQVSRSYEAIKQIADVLSADVPTETNSRARTQNSKVRNPSRKAKSEMRESDSPIEIQTRISPFITESQQKSFVDINGVTFPRYV
ncbi:hypothetical protein GPJ56_009244 [Histomonas meleagridis]|uniref:uncharacterized protein n=1 Tax=Histomonas meleagridis TaxID=135588 RepID=UPI0035599DDC|nr:hypothetical protein GPJ56_009244 [Histomonas meleagridis]KAH0801615.1 hypothetical protein GO595_005614 [Histomonas meleagridis]